MNPLHYIISPNGCGIAVGVVGNKELAACDGNLAENIFGVNHSDHLFDHLIYMKDVKQFKHFVILKEYFAIWDEHWTKNRVSGRRDSALDFSFARRAIKRARLVFDYRLKYEPFMQQISSRNTQYVLGGYQDEAGEE